MNWLKTWVVSLLGPKFIKDKLAQALSLLNGILVTQNIATAEQAQSLSESLLPILSNLILLGVSLALSISATKAGK